MRNAETILAIIRERGQHGLPVQDAYRLLYQRDLYLQAYGKIYRNKGAMTEGVTAETVDGMSLEKIDNIITLLRNEKYRWTPVRRTYISKKNGKLRPLGLPVWSDKLLQQVVNMILNAYYEPKFSDNSHGFRPRRGCHTALQKVVQKGKGSKWFIEGDLCACFDKIDHTILLKILAEGFQDNRFIRLINALLKAGYLEDWKFNNTFSGVPQGSIVGPICSNIVLDRLDKYVEEQLIPAYTSGRRRKANPAYDKVKVLVPKAKRKGDWKQMHVLKKQMQTMPSRDPNDPDYRRLWYVRYADDFLLGLIGSKDEAVEIKNKIADFLCNSLKLDLNSEKTLVTHARDQKAKFLGYNIHAMHEDSKHDRRGQRCINGSIGLCIPSHVIREKCDKYKKHGKPMHIPQRRNDGAYSIVAQYQSEYRGIVQYYRMAYNLHTLDQLKYVMEVSLVKTLSSKYKTTRRRIYKRYGARIDTDEGERKVILVKIDRKPPKKPLVTYFGGISLKWNKWVSMKDNSAAPILNHRSELEQRLLAQECELCGSHERIEVHHIRKLADLKQEGRANQPEWKRQMSERKRKTLAVCQTCHRKIHHGTYDGKKLTA
jgi:group II intron reverse transcriptase/maturase